MTFSTLAHTAMEAAYFAGDILKKGYHSSFEIKNKSGKNNLVTEYDVAAENAILTFLKERYPSHSFLAEKSGGILSSDSMEWIIDPLDGTSNFAHGIPTFSISIAARENGILQLGIIFHPLTGELFVAEKNQGAFCNGKKMAVSTTSSLEDAFIAFELPYNLQDNPGCIQEKILFFLQQGNSLQRTGSSALDLAYLAAGRYDAFFATELGAWDCAAGILLVEEAGGYVTSWPKKSFSLSANHNTVLASNPTLYKTLSQVIF